ncbi:general secretion pathway protein GspF [Candidatus Endoriftia persephone str. Guaymas]|jgi:general secretion pathway protein F|nr:type II secretion system F family protein [Candidatus Endoriftia persephone]EGV52485.1 general secretion pathway protein F [endosymbiont of Riftia pachyptila (vent Ph05)]MBA1331737.1 general secretion pathway protein GspF [Candidatus Endoriftia persephone str. Guaymas]USF86964.1 type II secretion system F family protein [Candidatus Endoriftia persephone]
MPNYFFKAASLDGEVTEGTTEGASREAVVKMIQAQGRVPIQVELSHALSASSKALKPVGLFRRNKDQLLLFTRELSTLLKAGLSLDRSLALLISVNSDPAFSQVLSALQEKIKGGDSFADALAAQQGIFPDIYISLARAGELGGTLESVMARLADHLERSSELKGSLKSAMIYPIILVIVAIVSIIILLTYVIPQFKELFEGMGAALPLSTAIVLQAGDLLKAYGWIFVSLIVLFVLWIRYQLQRPKGQYRWHRRVLSLPLLGELITKMEVAVFSRTLGTLLQNGIPMVKAMGIVRETLQNRVIADSMDGVINGLKEGARLTTQLKKAGCFPEFSVQMIGVGEESGELEQMLLHIAEIYDKEVNRSIKQSLAILEPMLILFLGVIVAGVIMSILVAIMGINQLVI